MIDRFSEDIVVTVFREDLDQAATASLIHYPEVETRGDTYVRPVVRIESGAKSALDAHTPQTIRPYIADELQGLDLAVPGVTTIEAERTFWDKVIIAHGLRPWYDRRGVLRQEGQRISRHYYDLHCLARSEQGRRALANIPLGADCVRHARMFFNRSNYDLVCIAGILCPSPSRWHDRGARS